MICVPSSCPRKPSLDTWLTIVVDFQPVEERSERVAKNKHILLLLILLAPFTLTFLLQPTRPAEFRNFLNYIGKTETQPQIMGTCSAIPIRLY
jgi:hypothetical protein